MNIVLGKFIIKDWILEAVHKWHPIEYYHVRPIVLASGVISTPDISNQPITTPIVTASYNISLRNPWGFRGVSDPNTWILLFDSALFRRIYHQMYNKDSLYFQTFTDLEFGKKHVDDFINKFSKLKAFI